MISRNEILIRYSHISITSVTYNGWCIVFATAFWLKDFINIEIIFQELVILLYNNIIFYAPFFCHNLILILTFSILIKFWYFYDQLQVSTHIIIFIIHVIIILSLFEWEKQPYKELLITQCYSTDKLSYWNLKMCDKL